MGAKLRAHGVSPAWRLVTTKTKIDDNGNGRIPHPFPKPCRPRELERLGQVDYVVLFQI